MSRSWKTDDQSEGGGKAVSRMSRRRGDIAVWNAYFASITNMLYEMFYSVSGNFQSSYTELKK